MTKKRVKEITEMLKDIKIKYESFLRIANKEFENTEMGFHDCKLHNARNKAYTEIIADVSLIIHELNNNPGK